ncbi:fibronectin type 3 domain-containing protein [Kitasatospora sp. GAS204A]|uniref:fibronectin type III domain-containing protein n=1 Tax=unclassified Kitasatospora TaxID=2633591 RepID=UPI002473D1F4|nr:cellulose binding domain-containing protein [Kitasatospora sp. GAS204B]MDH6121061.1 fibronectin type 3 domain-containing protein [Kitasatospora sp. GAS204B]
MNRTRRQRTGRLRRLTGQLLAVALVAMTAMLGTTATSGATSAATNSPRGASAAWTGYFDGFPNSTWHQNWGITPDTQQCQGATSTAPCNWGYQNMQAISDPTAPGSGQALKVTYPANSGPPSCGCGLDGGQFYQNLNLNGQQALAQSNVVDLKYSYNFPVGFDFGRKLAGKMPGLYGGVPGCESGGQHCNGGWSTRYMWRGGSANSTDGELYFYTASGSGYGADLCLGNWKFNADGKWHAIEQQVNVATGQITIWADGGATPVCQTTQTLGNTPASGVFFSTFHGGHDTSWSPSKTTTDEFADFTLATGQQSGGSSPATPGSLAVSGTTGSSATLTWSEADNGDPAASYKVYEGNTVVGTSTSTTATISGLTAGSSHTYTVTAVDAAGVESSHSAAVTASIPGNGPGSPATPTGLTVTNTTGTSADLAWTETDNSDPATSYDVYEGGTVVTSNTAPGATISNLAPGSTHTYTVTAVDASGVESTHSTPVTVQIPGGGVGLTASVSKIKDWGSGYTDEVTVTNNSTGTATGWNVQLNLDPTMNIESEASAALSSSGQHETFTNTSGNGTIAPGAHVTFQFSGDYSSHYIAPTSVTVTGAGNGSSSPAVPTGLAAGTTTSSSIALSWTETNNGDPAASYKIYEGGTVVGTSSAANATITGLAPSSTHTYTVTAVDSTGVESAASAPVTATTAAGGTSAPATPTGLTAGAITSSSIALSWTETNNSDPATSYKIYEGGTVVGSTASTSATITGLAPSSTHTYTVTAIDSAGSESTPSSSVTATTNAGVPTSPATPTGLTAGSVTSSSIALSWTETSNGDPATSYNVYEGNTVVGTSTSISATITGLAASSSHTYTVTAVDSAGTESAPSAPVTATTSAAGGGGAFSQTEIDSAVAAPLIAFAAPTSAVPRPGTNPLNIGAAKVLYYLALVDRQAPGSKASGGTTVDSALLAQVRHLIAGGNEPDADGGLEGWAHAPVAQALLLLKNGPAWSELTAAEQNKVTLLEEALGFAGNYTYNDANSFSSGICGFGNFSKTNNPNYRDGYVDVEAAAIQFFGGGAAWNSMLAKFDDATMASQLNAAGLTNAGGCYATVGTAANSAIHPAFVWEGQSATNLMGIWNQLAADTFDKTAQSTVSGAHIADGTTSPEEGKLGMGHEFNSTDSSGLRSSALYTFEGWMNVTGNRVAMSSLGSFSCSTASAAARYNVGTLDLIYKLHHGYISVALNQPSILVDDHGDPATDGPNVKGYQYDLDAYHALVATQGC